jgi:hypothetical protein
MVNRQIMHQHVRYFIESNDEYFVTIHEGKVSLFSQGNYICLTCPVILNNGIVVNLEGNIFLPDGTTRKLREGEQL